MRRIYESTALHRDDDDPFAPGGDARDVRPSAMRSVPSGLLSRLLVPHWLRYRAIAVDVSTPRPSYPVGASVPFTVTLCNRLPIPVTVPVESPAPWTWSVDGLTEASRVGGHPTERAGFRFDRGERKRFDRRWSGLFRVAPDEWQPAEPGEYALRASLAVPSAGARGLAAETTVELVPE